MAEEPKLGQNKKIQINYANQIKFIHQLHSQ